MTRMRHDGQRGVCVKFQLLPLALSSFIIHRVWGIWNAFGDVYLAVCGAACSRPSGDVICPLDLYMISFERGCEPRA